MRIFKYSNHIPKSFYPPSPSSVNRHNLERHWPIFPAVDLRNVKKLPIVEIHREMRGGEWAAVEITREIQDNWEEACSKFFTICQQVMAAAKFTFSLDYYMLLAHGRINLYRNIETRFESQFCKVSCRSTDKVQLLVCWRDKTLHINQEEQKVSDWVASGWQRSTGACGCIMFKSLRRIKSFGDYQKRNLLHCLLI